MVAVVEQRPVASARFIPNVAKVLEVILWLTNQRPGIDVYHVVKSVFLADKERSSEK